MIRQANIDLICVHCSATPPSMDIGASEIDAWHMARGWSGNGYSEVIQRSGLVELARPVGAKLAHARGHNDNAIAICLIGGVDENDAPAANYTDAQRWALWRRIVGHLMHFPDARLCGHRDLDPHKACPSFDVEHWWRTGELR